MTSGYLMATFAAVALVLAMAAESISLGQANPDDYQDRFLTSPRLVLLKGPSGAKTLICLAYFEKKDGKGVAASTRYSAPGRACRNDVQFYLGGSQDKGFEQGLSARASQFTGDPYQTAVANGTTYRYTTVPSAVYFRTKDLETGKSHWDAVCLGLIQTDTDKNPSYRSIVYPRDNSRDIIDGFAPEVKCGGIKFALANEIPSEKPDFLGSAEEIEKRARELKTE